LARKQSDQIGQIAIYAIGGYLIYNAAKSGALKETVDKVKTLLAAGQTPRTSTPYDGVGTLPYNLPSTPPGDYESGNQSIPGQSGNIFAR
jgi:hypothetical protein